MNGNLTIHQPGNNNINVVNVNGGILNVLGNCNFTGGTSSATQIGKLLVSSGQAIINGNVNWMSNTSVFSVQIEVNSGTLTLMNDLNMPHGSGVMNITGPGVVNFNGNTLVSLNLNSGAGTPAQLNTVNGCTLNFAKGITNSNVALNMANGSYAVFTGNSAITPNAAITFGHVYINSGISLTLNGDISVQNDWINSGGTFVPNNRRVSFTGTGQQVISKAGGETFYDVTSNTTGPIFLNDNVTILNNLTMTAGNFNLNNKVLFLGNGNPSSLNRTAGILYNGEFRRWWPAAVIISSSSGNFYGLFPIGTSSEYRPVMINSFGGTTGAGYIGVSHTDAYTVTDVTVAANDGMGNNVVRMHDQRSTVTNYGVTGGLYNLDVQFTGLSSVGTLAHMRLMPYLLAGVGTHVAAGGSVPAPVVRRTGLLIPNYALEN